MNRQIRRYRRDPLRANRCWVIIVVLRDTFTTLRFIRYAILTPSQHAICRHYIRDIYEPGLYVQRASGGCSPPLMIRLFTPFAMSTAPMLSSPYDTATSPLRRWFVDTSIRGRHYASNVCPRCPRHVLMPMIYYAILRDATCWGFHWRRANSGGVVMKAAQKERGG